MIEQTFGYKCNVTKLTYIMFLNEKKSMKVKNQKK